MKKKTKPRRPNLIAIKSIRRKMESVTVGDLSVRLEKIYNMSKRELMGTLLMLLASAGNKNKPILASNTTQTQPSSKSSSPTLTASPPWWTPLSPNTPNLEEPNESQPHDIR